METKEWIKGDKTEWGEGPWLKEPDQMQWTDEATSLPCIARRKMRGGSWCGYVGVSEGHPAFGKPYDDTNIDVHGGLTYSDFCDGAEGEGICHLPAPGEPDRVWWLGFDCAHGWDLRPGDAARYPQWRDSSETYKDLEYVKGECRKLARQLKAAA